MEITCVSGWWNIHNKFKGGCKEQANHMNKTLKIKAPFIFYYEEDEIKKKVEEIRDGMNTIFIKLNINEFYTYKYNNRLQKKRHYGEGWCPSKELWLVWMEKIRLCCDSFNNNHIKTQWLCWYDATLSKYRIGRQPIPSNEWPSNEKLHILDKNKINVSVLPSNRMGNGTFPPLVAGTAYIIHSNFINEFSKIFYDVVDELFNDIESKKHIMAKTDQFSDQYPLTYLCHKRPELFNVIAHGFGDCVEVLK